MPEYDLKTDSFCYLEIARATSAALAQVQDWLYGREITRDLRNKIREHFFYYYTMRSMFDTSESAHMPLLGRKKGDPKSRLAIPNFFLPDLENFS